MAYITDGDVGFIGLDSRTNPAALPAGYVQRSQNFRFNQGRAKVRGGVSLAAPSGTTFGTAVASGVYNYNGTEYIVLATAADVQMLNTSTLAKSTKTLPGSPAGDTSIASADIVQANGALYLLRGTSLNVLKWDGSASSLSAVSDFKKASSGIFFQDRMVVASGADEVSVSDFLAFEAAADWSALNIFDVLTGGGGSIVRLFPWQKDRLLVFGRSAIHVAHLSTGTGIDGDGTPLALGADAYLQLITNQLGAVAKNSVVAAGEYVYFLSDSGIHVLNPQLDLELTGMSQPLSEPIADIMERLSTAYASGAAAAFWNNRLYFAVPINSEPVDIVSVTYRDGGATKYADVVTSSAHGFATGDTVKISGSNIAYFDISATVTVTSTTAFSYVIGGTPSPTSSVSPNLSCQKVALRNNTVLVYSLLNKAWESVDTFYSGLYIDNLLLATYRGQKRLYAISNEIGPMIYEELEVDNTATGTGLKLPFVLPRFLISSDYVSQNISAMIRTRRYQFGNNHRKRFAAAEMTGDSPELASIVVESRTVNPDVEKEVYSHRSPTSGSEDFTARFRVAANGDSVEFDINCNALRPTISSLQVEATQSGRSLVTED